MYEEHTEILLDDQEWQTVNKMAIFNSIKELIGIGASKLLPAVLEWVRKRKVKEISTDDYNQLVHNKQVGDHFEGEDQELSTRFLIFSDDLCPDQVAFFGKISKAKYEKEWPQYTGLYFSLHHVHFFKAQILTGEFILPAQSIPTSTDLALGYLRR